MGPESRARVVGSQESRCSYRSPCREDGRMDGWMGGWMDRCLQIWQYPSTLFPSRIPGKQNCISGCRLNESDAGLMLISCSLPDARHPAIRCAIRFTAQMLRILGQACFAALISGSLSPLQRRLVIAFNCSGKRPLLPSSCRIAS